MLTHDAYLLRFANERMSDLRAESDRERLARLVQRQAQSGGTPAISEERPAARAGRRLAPVQLP